MEQQLSFYNAQFSYYNHNDYLKVQLDVNSEDKILAVGYKTSNKEFSKEIGQLISQIVGKRIEDISFGQLGLFSIPAFTVWMAIQDYVEGLHQNFNSYGGNPEELICRCKKIDKSTLQASIDKNQADKKKIIEQLQVSQICGGCKDQFESLLAQSSWRQSYFADVPNSRWIDNIHAALSRAALDDQQPLPSMSYEVIRYQNNNVKLRASGDRNGLNRFELTEKLQNFLQEKIHPEIKVSVVL